MKNGGITANKSNLEIKEKTMENMTQEEFLQKIESNELYQKSKALHKDYQLRQMTSPNGLIQSVTTDGGRIKEFWKDGVPVKIEE